MFGNYNGKLCQPSDASLFIAWGNTTHISPYDSGSDWVESPIRIIFLFGSHE